MITLGPNKHVCAFGLGIPNFASIKPCFWSLFYEWLSKFHKNFNHLITKCPNLTWGSPMGCCQHCGEPRGIFSLYIGVLCQLPTTLFYNCEQLVGIFLALVHLLGLCTCNLHAHFGCKSLFLLVTPFCMFGPLFGIPSMLPWGHQTRVRQLRYEKMKLAKKGYWE